MKQDDKVEILDTKGLPYCLKPFVGLIGVVTEVHVKCGCCMNNIQVTFLKDGVKRIGWFAEEELKLYEGKQYWKGTYLFDWLFDTPSQKPISCWTITGIMLIFYAWKKRR